MNETRTLTLEQEAQQKARQDSLKNQRDFLEQGKQYRDSILPTENIIKDLEAHQETGAVIKRGVNEISQAVARKKKQLAVAETVFQDNRADRYQNTEENTPQNDQLSDAEQQLYAVLEKSPLFQYLQKSITNPELLAQVKAQLAETVSTYAHALTKADQVNSEDNRAGQVSYDFAPFLETAAQDIMKMVGSELPEGTALADLTTLIDQAQVRIETNLTQEGKYFSLLNWVVQTARKVRTEGLRIFDTPETQEILARLDAAAEQKNGLGGVILYGPPGTGKTEMLVARNKARGFDSRVISIHHFTDYVQLMGEKPIPISNDKTNTYLERLTHVKDAISGLEGDAAVSFVKNKQSEGAVAWANFLKLANLDPAQYPTSQEIDQEKATQILQAMIQKLTANITFIGLGLEEGLTEEIAWAKGEIIQAFDNGQLPILDEMDKGSAHSLEGISRLLNMSPGQEIPLGNDMYQIPSWAHVDGTANAMNLPGFLHDRFAPNVIYIDYASPEDTLQKSLVWLSDEQGKLTVSNQTQEQFLGLVLYVFPEIQKLYPDTLEHPLSNRGIRKFCQMLTLGTPMSEALDDLLLKQGALTDTQQGREAVQAILDRFANLISPAVSMPESGDKSGKADIFTSPLYKAALESYRPYNITKRKLEKVDVNSEMVETLADTKDPIAENETPILDTKVGTEIGLEEKKGKQYLVVRVEGSLLTRVATSEKFTLDKDASKVIAADRRGRLAVVRTNNDVQVVDIQTGETARLIASADTALVTITADGTHLVKHEGSRLSLIPVNKLDTDTQANNTPEIGFVDEDGDPLEVARFDLSNDGQFLLVESKTRETYVVNLDRIQPDFKKIALTRPFLKDANWSIGRGNLLFKESAQSVYTLKA